MNSPPNGTSGTTACNTTVRVCQFSLLMKEFTKGCLLIPKAFVDAFPVAHYFRAAHGAKRRKRLEPNSRRGQRRLTYYIVTYSANTPCAAQTNLACVAWRVFTKGCLLPPLSPCKAEFPTVFGREAEKVFRAI